MNNLKITIDGRVTAWNAKSSALKSFKAPILRQSAEWELFCTLPPEAKMEYLSGMGSSHVAISEKPLETYEPKAARGSKGITAIGRSRVRCAAQWLEEQHGLKNLTFLTCTLPPESLAAYTSRKWAEVVNRFVKWLRYHLAKCGLSNLLVAVTEIQMQRWEVERGQPPVHLHCLFQGRERFQHWAYPPDFYQDGWQQAVQSVMGEHSDWSASTRVESLRSSSVNYLGKYMSKGSKVIQGACLGSLPSSWYSITDELRNICKSCEVRVSGALAVAYVKEMQEGSYMLWQRYIVEYEKNSFHLWYMGWAGAIRGRGKYWEIVNDIRSAIWGHERVGLTCAL